MTISTKLMGNPKMPQASRPSRYLTPLQLVELKKGPRANILIGLEGDYFIGLEGVAVNLLAHFSPSAKAILIDEGSTAVCMPGGSKEPLRWIYKYMQAGEADPEGEMTFEQLSVNCLITLYSHSAPLHYQSLMDRVVGRLEGKYHDALPTVDEIKAFANFVPPLYDHAVTILAYELINPWACDYSAYIEYMKTDKDFGAKLDKAIRKLLKHRVKAGQKYYKSTTNRHVLWSKQYYANLSKDHAKVNAREIRMSKVKIPAAADSNLKKGSSSAVPKNKKKRAGRRSRKPAQSANDTSLHHEALTAGNNKELENKQRGVNALRCWNCNGRGHRARDCTVSSEGMETLKKAPA